MVGGLLLQTTRNSIVKSCQQRFSKFVTRCTYTQQVYDLDTGKEVVEANVTDGLLPYGVDAVFLSTASEYDASLSVGKCPAAASPLHGMALQLPWHEVDMAIPRCLANANLLHHQGCLWKYLKQAPAVVTSSDRHL